MIDTAFPFWVVRKIGSPLLVEADWNYGSFPNAKFGLFAATTGTIARDTTNLLVGGAGSLKLLTAATSNDSTEVKHAHHYINAKKDYLALEMKWASVFQSGGTNMQVGIENRNTSNIRHVRFRYTVTTGKWMYQDTDLTYKDFPSSVGGALAVEKPIVSATSGTKYGWCRCVIDPENSRYVGFEASGPSRIETRDMRSMALSCPLEGASTANELLFFALVAAGGAFAEPAYVTDWCISRIPNGIDPFGASWDDQR